MKHWNIQTKISFSLIGLVAIMLLLLLALSFCFESLNSLRNDVLVFVNEGEGHILKAQNDVMNMRRMTGMIHAMNGDEQAIDGFQKDFDASYLAAGEHIDSLIANFEAAVQISEEDRAAMIGHLRATKDYIGQYKTLLFDPNVEYAKRADVDALNAANAEYGSLIASVNESFAAVLDSKDRLKEASFAKLDSAKRIFIIVFSAVALAIIGGALSYSLLLAKQIARPLVSLGKFMKRASSTGDFAMTAEEREILRLSARGGDEAGSLVASCWDFIDRIGLVGKICHEISEQNLTSDPAPLSDRDELGLALQTLTGGLNKMVSNLRQSSLQISSGSDQISVGAETLAEASTEQSHSVEQLSRSVEIITEKTGHNTQRSAKAVALADSIKRKAEDQIRQMEEMNAAMKAINESSHNIAKIIKVIDDIAFQTNILALNAAVEAARAGQHGKGFAVVAEEVRNLASKSAEAAKNTGDLIASSLAKASLGSGITDDTTESLMGIVSDINENSTLVREINRSITEQTESVEAINNGLGQILKVVQHNSALSEECASMAIEMNGQSHALNELVLEFRLRDTALSQPEPPPSTPVEARKSGKASSDRYGVGMRLSNGIA